MKVLKFGGTSVGTVESLHNVKAIVESCEENVVVVVSALGGITDKLINTAAMAASGDVAFKQQYQEIVDRHNAVIAGIVPVDKQAEVHAITDDLLQELGNLFVGISLIKDLGDHTRDIITSYGERLSSAIIARVIEGATHFDSRNFVKTNTQFGKHFADLALTERLIKETLGGFEGKVALVPGFISSDAVTGEVTNLGRGGSDYTAALIAAALDADSLEIWTDVDGFMTADPRVIKNAYVIDRLSFIEAMELCNFGAKVVYPPTIYPVFHKNIPILIKNTFNPSAPGSLIANSEENPEDKPIKGISSINDTCLITLTGFGMVGVIGINSRIFRALASNGVSVFLVAQASSEHNTTLAVRNADAQKAVDVLSEEFAAELQTGDISDITAEQNLATVAIVGEGMKGSSGIAGRLFNTLGRNGINVKACAQGASETNVSFVIEKDYLRKALNVIHDSFFLSETQVLNLFITGVGNVGRSLVNQIRKQHQLLKENKLLEIRVVGLSNSRKCIFDRDGLDTSDIKALLESATIPSTPENIKNEIINMNIFNSVFVDCTASADIAAIYGDLLDHNVSVVAANKIAAAGPYAVYKKLKDIAHRRDVKYLFETNVGAGLPIINTINNLRNSGDKIVKIEAVLSGTINYIFNTISKDIPFSKAVKMAQENGYSEPDPRVDLSGTDVARKITILARESGYVVEQADVEKHLFVPDEYFQGSVDDFFTKMPALDAQFEEMRAKAEAEQKRIRFVASLVDGKLSIGLREVDVNHAFYTLEGSTNVILISTSRYYDYPMEIKGYGAGAEVTAAGVFADIISIANIR